MAQTPRVAFLGSSYCWLLPALPAVLGSPQPCLTPARLPQRVTGTVEVLFIPSAPHHIPCAPSRRVQVGSRWVPVPRLHEPLGRSLAPPPAAAARSCFNERETRAGSGGEDIAFFHKGLLGFLLDTVFFFFFPLPCASGTGLLF